MNTNNLLVGLVIVLIIVFVITRQLFPKRVTMVTLFGLPILAAYAAVHSLPRPIIPMHEALECAVTAVLSILAGYIQTRDTRLIVRPDGFYYRGGWVYIATWFGLLLARLLTTILFQGLQGMTHFSQHEWILYVDVAMAWGTRSLMLCARHAESCADSAKSGVHGGGEERRCLLG